VGDEVDSRLHGEHEPGLQLAGHPQVLQTELAASGNGGVVADVILAQVLHVVDVETEHVPQPVGEEEGVGALVDRLLGVTPHQADLLQPGGDGAGSRHVHLLEHHTGLHRPDRVLLRIENDLVDLLLLRGEAA